jgi:transcriptional regulator with XRE-family HTH domain
VLFFGNCLFADQNVTKKNMEPADIFRKNVKTILKQRGLKQSHVAKEINEQSQKLNSYLNGHINWGEVKRKKLATYLKVEYHKLYDRELLAGIEGGAGLGVEAGAEIVRANHSGSVAELEHSDILKNFKNPPLAKIINSRLVHLESLDPAQLEDILATINSKIKTLEIYLKKGMDRRKLDQPDKIPETGDRRKAVG